MGYQKRDDELRSMFLRMQEQIRPKDQQLAEKARKIVLVDGNKLTELMIRHGLGVRKKPLEVPEVDEEYFEGL